MKTDKICNMFLYYLIIYPIRQIIEIFYILFAEITKSAGISVIGLSFVVTLCCLPLYIIAESWQEKERIIEEKMKSGVLRIKKAFRGDERFMILSTYYRQNGYHPIMALRSSFGLLIQIPFFIAAYSFLSHLGALKGTSFLFIKDMGAPDAMFKIGGFSINILPVIMTAINCISGAVYSKGHRSIREKLQIYISAFVFLVLLYNSPAGLVLYWTMNNLLSLVKNLFYKMKNPLKTLYIIAAIFAAAGIFTAVFAMKSEKTELRAIVAFFCALVAASPVLLHLANIFFGKFFSALDLNPRTRFSVFILSVLVIATLTGFAIPSMLMESEPQEFCFIDNYTSPFIFMKITVAQALGFYVFWPFCFYALFGSKAKKILTFSTAFLAAYALVNNFLFTGSYGPLTQNIDFMEAQFFTAPPIQILLNLLCAVLIFSALVLILTKKPSIAASYSAIVLAGLFGISVRNTVIVADAYSKMGKPQPKTSIEPVYHLSKTGRNVIVFMQDRLFSPFIDPVFEEKPGLVDHFEGFVFYPNTVSLGKLTMLGTPGIFGGYSYTPAEMNLRTEQTIQQKHNEAILSMPVSFLRAGFEATVSDMPYENFDKEPLTAMYKDYPEINRVWTHGVYSDFWYRENGVEKTAYISTTMKHNFIMFGIFKTFPPFLRRLVNHERWWNTEGRKDHFSQFVDNYSCLLYFPRLFDISSEKDTFTMIDNLATHEPTILQYPDYVPQREVTNAGPTKLAKNAQYNTQAGVMRCYAKFFDYLRENGVYDNTRIIIVSDHGTSIKTGKFDENCADGKMPFLKENVTASLIVKDFNDRRKSPDGIHLPVDMTFMTNADTPAIATKDIIPNARNPFTGLPYYLEGGAKQEYIKISYAPAESTRNRLHTKLKIPNDGWWTVRDNIYESSNWKQIFPFGEKD